VALILKFSFTDFLNYKKINGSGTPRFAHTNLGKGGGRKTCQAFSRNYEYAKNFSNLFEMGVSAPTSLPAQPLKFRPSFLPHSTPFAPQALCIVKTAAHQ
jgi:hypothetical protein